jgi:hypothetical protein
MTMRKANGFFWFEIKPRHYCVVAIDKSRKERIGRTQKVWSREWHAESLKVLRDMARDDGIVLPRNLKALCENKCCEDCTQR